MARKKLKNRGGFTLAETLLAVAILLLVSAIVATGMPAAKNAYEKVVLASNAEVLLSTAASALRDELGTAWRVRQPSANVLTYFSADTGMRSKLYVDGSLKITEYMGDSTDQVLLGLVGTNMDNTTVKTDRNLVYQAPTDMIQFTVTANLGEPVYDSEKKEYFVTISNLCVKYGDDILAEWVGKDASGKSTKEFSIPVFSVET